MKILTPKSVIALAVTLGLSAGLSPRALAQPAGQPNSDTSMAAVANAVTNLEDAELGATNLPDIPAPADAQEPEPRHPRHAHGAGGGDNVTMGHDAVVSPGQTVEDVVVIGGSATVHGTVRQDVVVIGGDLDSDGQINGDAVAVFGSIRLKTNAVVKGDTVAVMGGVEVQTNASVGGDVVGIGGKTDVADGAKVRGEIVPINFGMGKFGVPGWLEKWLKHCVLKMRPLAPQVGWVWVVAGIFFLLYLLVSVVLPKPVAACVEELSNRTVTTFFLGLLTKLLVPLVCVILAMTVIGLVVVPFILVAVVLGAIVGKVAILQWLGGSLGRQFGVEELQRPLAALVVGAALVTALYLVPVLGLLTYTILGLWGLGAAVAAAFRGMRREIPPRSLVPPPGLASAPMAVPNTAAMAGAQSGFGSTASALPGASPMPDATGQAGTMPPPLTPFSPAPVPETLTYPRAGFLIRMAAAFLDAVLLAVVCGLAHLGKVWPLVGLAYLAALWSWKGSTIGNIVLGLKVVREDGQPVSFVVALVRALATAFSMIVLFLGILWIAWDPEKQGWHDKIAGTVVLRMPRGTPLVCV